jgi:hypothetical protein
MPFYKLWYGRRLYQTPDDDKRVTTHARGVHADVRLTNLKGCRLHGTLDSVSVKALTNTMAKVCIVMVVPGMFETSSASGLYR